MLNSETALNKDKRTGKASMEHRHFCTVATIITQMDGCHWDRETITNHFAEELRSTNPRFDRKRFLKACGVSAS